jgi:hypothetical protein
MGFFKKLFGGIVDDLKKSLEDSEQEVHDELVSKSSTSSTSPKPRRESSKKPNEKKVKKQEETVKQPEETSKTKSTKQSKESVVKQPNKKSKAKKTEQFKETIVEEPKEMSSIEPNEKVSKVEDPVSAPPFDSMVEEAEPQPISDEGVFSARFEALINSALQDGVLTDQEIAILKKRAEKEGEDWDEVEMIINSRLAEVKEKTMSPQKEEESTIIEKTDSVDDLKKVTLVLGDCRLDNYVQVLRNTLDMSALESIRIVEKIKPGRPFTLELDSLDIAKQLLIEIEKVGGKAHHGNPTPEDLIVKVYGRHPENHDKSFIEVPEGVIEIESLAFANLNMKEIKMPSTLKKIGNSSFYNCKKLEQIDFSKCTELLEIEDRAFYGCNIKEIKFPSTLKLIGTKSFFNCKKLKQIDFSKCTELLEIEDEAFSQCENLVELDFSQCTALKKIGTKAFYECGKLKKIDLSKCAELREIEDDTFYWCWKLEEITLPDSVTRIGDDAFRCCNLKKFDMPASLEEVGETVFYTDGNRMETIDFSKVKNLKVIPRNFGVFEVLMLPNGVESVEDNAFTGYSGNQKKLFLPPSLRSFGKGAGEWERIYLYAPLFDNINNILVDNDDVTLYVLPQYLEEYERYQEALEEDSGVDILPMPDEYLYFYDN